MENKKYKDNNNFNYLLRLFNRKNEFIYEVNNNDIIEMFRKLLNNEDYWEDINDFYYDNGGI